MIRAFIAVDIPESICEAVRAAQDRLKRTRLDVKVAWTNIGNLHLTVQFLGSVEETMVPRISQGIAAVSARHSPFELRIHGSGSFPDVRRPRVLWVGCADEQGRLKGLASDVQAAMQPLGFPPEDREFSAHLTLGRIKFPRPDDALTRALDSLKDSAFGTMRVAEIHLYQSQLHPEGSIYSKLTTHALGAQH